MKLESLQVKEKLVNFVNCQPPLTFGILSKVIHRNARVENSSWIICFYVSYYFLFQNLTL